MSFANKEVMSHAQATTAIPQGSTNGRIEEPTGYDNQVYADWLVGQLSKRQLSLEERHWLDQNLMRTRSGDRRSRTKNGSVRALGWLWGLAILAVGALAAANWLL